MAEKLCELRKNGGGKVSANLTASSPLTSISPSNFSSTGKTDATAGKYYTVLFYGTQAITNWNCSFTGASVISSVSGGNYMHEWLIKATSTTIKGTLSIATGVTSAYITELNL